MLDEGQLAEGGVELSRFGIKCHPVILEQAVVLGAAQRTLAREHRSGTPGATTGGSGGFHHILLVSLRVGF